MFDYALRIAGFAVTAVRDGFAGRPPIEQQCPEIVVLDCYLPHVSGMDVHQEIVSHAETCKIPIVVVTGTNWEYAGRSLLDAAKADCVGWYRSRPSSRRWRRRVTTRMAGTTCIASPVPASHRTLTRSLVSSESGRGERPLAPPC